MAKPLQDRQQAALRPSARLSDVRALIDETREAITFSEAEAGTQRAASLDPANTPSVSQQARHAAADAEFYAERHREALRKLEAKETELLENEEVAARLDAYTAAEAGRNELVADLRKQWPQLTDALIGLLRRIQASDDQLAKINGALPKGKPRLESAEAEARRVPSNFYANGVPIGRLRGIKLPNFNGSGHAWPLPRAVIDHGALYAAQAEQAARERKATANRFKRYRLVSTLHEPTYFTRKPVDTQAAQTWFADGATVQWIEDREAERLNAIPGITATLADGAP